MSINDKITDVVSMSVSSTPYDEHVIISPSNDNISIQASPFKSVLDQLIKTYLPLFFILIFLLYLLYQIILAGFNCRVEDSNLSWIRASFFLNIPFLLAAIFIIIKKWKKKKSLLFAEFTHSIILLYAIFFIVYWIVLGIWKEIVELQKIGNVLANATNVSLPCSMNYYEHVYYLEISFYQIDRMSDCLMHLVGFLL